MLFSVRQDSPSSFAVSVRSVAHASISGVLDATTLPLFRATIGELDAPTVLLDVAGLVGADDAGLQELAAEDASRRSRHGRHGRLVLVEPPMWLQDALRAAGFGILLAGMAPPRAVTAS